MDWTLELVMDRYFEAIETLKLLPADWPRRYFTMMPQPIRKASESFNWDGARADLERSARVAATPDAIDRLDEVLEWNRWLTRGEVRVVWGWALGAPRMWIARKIRRDRRTVDRWRKRAMNKVLGRLNGRRAENLESCPEPASPG